LINFISLPVISFAIDVQVHQWNCRIFPVFLGRISHSDRFA